MFVGFSVWSPVLRAEGKGGDFPPEVDYPDDAYENEDGEAKDDEYLQPKEKRGERSEKPERKKERRASQPPPRPKRVERMTLPDEESSSKTPWWFFFEFASGLNQVTALSAVDPDREAVGLKDSLIFGGDMRVQRGHWGIELDGRYAFTPIQEVVIAGPPSTTQNRSLRSWSALFGLSYRYGFGSSFPGIGSRYQLIARVGYGWAAVTQEIETTAGITNHHAQTNAPYIGIGFEARWIRYLSTSIDFYQSIAGSGRLGPTDSAASGYGYYSLQIGNRVRLIAWENTDVEKAFGLTLNVNIQSLSTPTPPTGNKAGGDEKAFQILGGGYLNF